MTNLEELTEKLKKQIQFEEGMDDSMLSFYIENATDYVKKATGGNSNYLIIMIATIMFDYRVSEKEMGDALDAMTPFFVLEVFADEEDDE